MRDWTYSFVRNASTLERKSEELELPPPAEPNTTLMKLHHLPGQYTSLFDFDDPPLEEIPQTTPEGRALLGFLLSLEKEPGHRSTTWGRAEELDDHIFILIGIVGITKVCPNPIVLILCQVGTRNRPCYTQRPKFLIQSRAIRLF